MDTNAPKKKPREIKDTWNSYDENGHRIARTEGMTHRKTKRVGQVNPEVYHLHVYIPFDDMAKAMQFCKGRKTKVVPIAGRKAHIEERNLTVGDLVREYLHAAYKNIVLDDETKAWLETKKKHLEDRRALQDAMIAAGVNRIPKDEQLKRGTGAESYKAKKAAAKK